MSEGVPYLPAIDLDLKVELHKLPSGGYVVVVSGTHDGFPAYEVLVSINCGPWFGAYQYNPLDVGATPNSLIDLGLGIGKVDVHAFKRVDSKGAPIVGGK